MGEIAAERARIARELHDVMAQDLAAIGYALDGEIGRSDTTPASRNALRAIRSHVTALNAQIRNEIFVLRCSSATGAIALVESAAISLGISLTIVGNFQDSSDVDELAKILIELLRNSKEHGHATNAVIEISDDVIAFTHNGELSIESVAIAQASSQSYGLIGISERAALIGWELHGREDFSGAKISRRP